MGINFMSGHDILCHETGWIHMLKVGSSALKQFSLAMRLTVLAGVTVPQGASMVFPAILSSTRMFTAPSNVHGLPPFQSPLPLLLAHLLLDLPDFEISLTRVKHGLMLYVSVMNTISVSGLMVTLLLRYTLSNLWSLLMISCHYSL
jgi:hypothetical protein